MKDINYHFKQGLENLERTILDFNQKRDKMMVRNNLYPILKELLNLSYEPGINISDISQLLREKIEQL